jgi:hypothetical protein
MHRRLDEFKKIVSIVFQKPDKLKVSFRTGTFDAQYVLHLKLVNKCQIWIMTIELYENSLAIIELTYAFTRGATERLKERCN